MSVIVPGQSAPATGSAVAGSPLPPVPDHELLRVIGRGAYGEVWLARHTRLDTLRAVKIIRRDQFGDVRPFTREFDGIQKYEPISRSHPHLVSILHVGGTDDCFYYVMELADDSKVGQASSLSGVDGSSDAKTGKMPVPLFTPHTLRSELKQHGAFPMDRVLEIAHALASALAHLHAHKLVHRDVKPSNVIFVGGVPKLADIGLVAGVDDARSFVGTEGYVPFHGAGTPSADCYSLGKLLYELSTGHDRTAWPEPPADLATRANRERLLELNAILHRACAPYPRQRYPNAQAMLAEVEMLQRHQSVKQKRAWQRRWAFCKNAGLVAVLVALAAIVALHFTRGGPDDYVQSSDSEVNKLVEQGFYAHHEGTPRRARYAEECFRKALQRDPKFIPALYGLAVHYLNDRSEFRAMTEELKKIALNAAETWQCVAYDEWCQGRFREALADIKRATRKRAACRDGRVWTLGGYGYFLQNMGDAEGALEQYRLAERITGIDPTILDHFGHTYFMRSNLVEALNYYQASIDFMPTHLNGRSWKARTLEEMGRFEEAIREYEERDRLAEEDAVETKRFYDGLRNALQQDGPEGYWRQRLVEEMKKASPNLYCIAMFYARLGDKYRGYDCLEKAFKQNPFAGELLVDLCWDRNDERFKAFARKIGLTQ